MTYATSTTGPEQTASLAKRLAGLLRGGEVIELASDLGGGKTTFTQALAAALGYEGAVTSPTFTLSQIYKLPNGHELHHYDLYRLNESGIVGDELAEDMGADDIITVIEWGGVAGDILPVDRLRIEIEVTGDQSRDFRFASGGRTSAGLIKELSV